MGNEKTIEVKGKDLGDVLVREAALSKLNGLETDELVKLSKMANDKGRKALKTKWNLIKSFI
jgi:hypothetical protein